MQLDADEDGEPFFRPPAVTAAPPKQQTDQGEDEESGPDQRDPLLDQNQQAPNPSESTLV